MKNEQQEQGAKPIAMTSGSVRTFEEIKQDIEVYWRLNPKYQKARKEKQEVRVADNIISEQSKGRTMAVIAKDLEAYWKINFPVSEVKQDRKT